MVEQAPEINEDILTFQIEADLISKKFLCLYHDSPYLTIELVMPNLGESGHTMVRVYKSSNTYDTVKPRWEAYSKSMR